MIIYLCCRNNLVKYCLTRLLFVKSYNWLVSYYLTRLNRCAFAYCSGLKQVTLSESVISIGDSAFYESGLQSVNIGASVTNIGSNAFACCKNLREVRYSGTLEMWDNIVKGKSAFQKGVKLTCKGITGGTSTGSNI